MKNKINVFEELGFTKGESMAMEFKAELYLRIIKIIKGRKLTSKEMQKVLDVPHTRVSELMNAKLSTMSIEKLLTYLEKLGFRAVVSLKPPKVG